MSMTGNHITLHSPEAYVIVAGGEDVSFTGFYASTSKNFVPREGKFSFADPDEEVYVVAGSQETADRVLAEILAKNGDK